MKYLVFEFQIITIQYFRCLPPSATALFDVAFGKNCTHLLRSTCLVLSSRLRLILKEIKIPECYNIVNWRFSFGSSMSIMKLCFRYTLAC